MIAFLFRELGAEAAAGAGRLTLLVLFAGIDRGDGYAMRTIAARHAATAPSVPAANVE